MGFANHDEAHARQPFCARNDPRATGSTIAGQPPPLGTDASAADGLPRCRPPAHRAWRHQNQPRETRDQVGQPQIGSRPWATQIPDSAILPGSPVAVAAGQIRSTCRNADDGSGQVESRYRHAACSRRSRRRPGSDCTVGQSSLVRNRLGARVGNALLATPRLSPATVRGLRRPSTCRNRASFRSAVT